MVARFTLWIRSLQLKDPVARQQAIPVQWMFLGILVASVLSIPVGSSLASTPAGQLTIAVATAALLPCVAVAWYLLRKGRFELSVILMTLGWEACLAIYLIVLGLTSSGPILLIFALPVTLAGLLTRRSGLLIALGGELLIVALVAVLEVMTPPLAGFAPPQSISTLLVFAVFLLGIGLLSVLLLFFTGSLRTALQTALTREQELEQVRARQVIVIDEQTASLRATIETVEYQKAQLAQTVEELEVQQAVIRSLSAPILPVFPGVLVPPIVGTIDHERASVLQQNVLKAVEMQHAHHVIFDVTGILYIDEPVANTLIQTAAAVNLLGANVIMVGIRPEVAQTLSALGLVFQNIVTYANLQEAVQTIADRHRARLLQAAA